MGQLTAEMIAKLSGFRQEIIDALTADLNAGAAVDAVSASGACSLTRVVTELTISGTKAYTLAAPTFTGQKKIIRCVSAASTPIGTLTVSSPDDTSGFVCPATFVFDTGGQEIELEGTAGLKWRCVRKKRAGSLAVVVGTTVLTGYSMASVYVLSVTGTVSSTSTKALPNGAAIGERCVVSCGTAASTPIGNINATLAGMDGTAYTDIGAIGVAASATVTGDYAMLEWNGQKWQVITQSGCTLS